MIYRDSSRIRSLVEHCYYPIFRLGGKEKGGFPVGKLLFSELFPEGYGLHRAWYSAGAFVVTVNDFFPESFLLLPVEGLTAALLRLLGGCALVVGLVAVYDVCARLAYYINAIQEIKARTRWCFVVRFGVSPLEAKNETYPD